MDLPTDDLPTGRHKIAFPVRIGFTDPNRVAVPIVAANKVVDIAAPATEVRAGMAHSDEPHNRRRNSEQEPGVEQSLSIEGDLALSSGARNPKSLAEGP